MGKRTQRSQEPPATTTGPTARQWLAASGLLLLFAVLAGSALLRSGRTFDEIAHITRGMVYWEYDDYRFQDNGNLSDRWMALGAMAREDLPDPAGDGRRDPDTRHAMPDLRGAWQRADVWTVGWGAFEVAWDGGHDALIAARRMVVIPGVLLGGLIWLWSHKRFGPAGGLVSLVLFTFSPTLLAHAGLATSDLMAAYFLLAASGALWMVLHRLTPFWLLCSLVAVTFCTLSKMSGLLIAPIGLILAGIVVAGRRPIELRARSRRREVTRRGPKAGAVGGLLLVHVAVAALGIWTAFGLRYEAHSYATTPGDRFPMGAANPLGRETSTGRAIDFVQRHRLLPEGFTYSLSHMLAKTDDRPIFAAGGLRPGGVWWFYPYAFAIKTSDGVLLVLLLAAGTVVLRRRTARAESPGGRGAMVSGEADGHDRAASRSLSRLYDVAPLLVLMGVYLVATFAAGPQIGHRHLLPIYPPLLILAGAAGRWWGGPRIARAALALCLLVVVVEGGLAWPNYLPYFNRASGGSMQGYTKLVDSSLDWGQGLPDLKHQLSEIGAWERADNGDRPVVYLSYFGLDNPNRCVSRAAMLPAWPEFDKFTGDSCLYALEPGVYVVSATALQGGYSPLSGAWTDEREAAYQQMHRLFAPGLRSAPCAEIPGGEPSLRYESYRPGDLRHTYDVYRAARLMAYLRTREPDDRAGPTFLIYRLSAAELSRALDGAPPE